MELLAWLVLTAIAAAAASPSPPGPVILPLDNVGVNLRFSVCRSGGVGGVLGSTLLTAPTLGSQAFTVAWQPLDDARTVLHAVLFSQPAIRRLDVCRLTAARRHPDDGIRVWAGIADNGTVVVEIAATNGSGVCRFATPTTAGDSDHLLAVGPFDGCVREFGEVGSHCFAGACELGSLSLPSAAGLIRSKRAAAVCSPGYCKNGGVCNPVTEDPVCICPLPYIAPSCEAMSNFCTQEQPEAGILRPICMNGTCIGTVPTPPYFNCTCDLGFNGNRCDKNIDDCSPNPCVNAACVDLVNNFSCECYKGWQGRNCSVDIDDCASPTVCANRTNCVDGNSTCTCKPGWRGANCSLSDLCSPVSACPNGTACVNLDPVGVECRGAATFGYAQSLPLPAGQAPLRLAPSAGLSEAPASARGRARSRATAASLPQQLLSVTTRAGRQLTLSLTPSGQLTLAVDNQTATAPPAGNASLATGEQFSFSATFQPGARLSLSVATGNGSLAWSAESPGPLANDTGTDPIANVTLGDGFKGCLEEVRLNSRIVPLGNWSAGGGRPGFDWLAPPANQSWAPPLIGCQGDPVCAARPCLNSGRCQDLWNAWSCQCDPGYSGVACGVVNCSVAACSTAATPLNVTSAPAANSTAPSNNGAIAAAGVSTPVVVVLCVLALIVVIVIIVVVVVKLTQRRRAESGQYKPSKEETQHDQPRRGRDPDTDLDDNYVMGDLQVAKL